MVSLIIPLAPELLGSWSCSPLDNISSPTTFDQFQIFVRTRVVCLVSLPSRVSRLSPSNLAIAPLVAIIPLTVDRPLCI